MKYIVRALAVWLLAVIAIVANSQATQTFKTLTTDSSMVIPRFAALPSYGRPGAIVFITAGTDSGLWVKRTGAGWMKSGSGGSIVAGGVAGDLQLNGGGSLVGIGGAELYILRRRGGTWVAEPDSIFTNGFVQITNDKLLRYAGNWRNTLYDDSTLVHKKYVDSMASLGSAAGNQRNIQYKMSGVNAGSDSLQFNGSELQLRGRLNFSTLGTAPSALSPTFEDGGRIQYANTNSYFSVLQSSNNSLGGGSLLLGNTFGSSTASGSRLGALVFGGGIGNIGASIRSFATQGFNGSNTPGDLRFYTTANGSTSHLERVRIDQDGSLDFKAYGAGTKTGTATYGLGVDASGNVVEMPADGRTTSVGSTTNATPLTVVTLTIADNTTGTIEIVTNGTTSAGFVLGGRKMVTYKKVAGTLTLFTIQTVGTVDADSGLSTASFTMVGSSNNVAIQVTGVAATNIDWKVTYSITKLNVPV